MANQKGESPIGKMIGKPPIERDIDMADATESSGEAGATWRKTTRVSHTATSEQWEQNTNGN